MTTGRTVLYTCRTCNAEHAAASLARGPWGDHCCPRCGSPDLKRRRSRRETLYGIFFLYKVY
ncbi:MAG TPA: hypothetical protein VNL77_20425 [Roseiflexaceae bacterium]|nr:hypothetical protein [Roseiflexaceae bacterium]